MMCTVYRKTPDAIGSVAVSASGRREETGRTRSTNEFVLAQKHDSELANECNGL